MIGVSDPGGPLFFMRETATFQFHDRFRTQCPGFATMIAGNSHRREVNRCGKAPFERRFQ